MAKQRKDGGNGDSEVCSFCSRTAAQVTRLISGPPGIAICNECVDVCGSLLRDPQRTKKEAAAAGPARGGRLLSPAEIKAHLDQYIIGQERAKRVISVAVHNHYKRLLPP